MYFDLHLVKLEYSRQILKNTQTSHENPSSERRVVLCGRMDGLTDRHDKGNSLFRNLRTRLKTELQYAKLHICR